MDAGHTIDLNLVAMHESFEGGLKDKNITFQCYVREQRHTDCFTCTITVLVGRDLVSRITILGNKRRWLHLHPLRQSTHVTAPTHVVVVPMRDDDLRTNTGTRRCCLFIHSSTMSTSIRVQGGPAVSSTLEEEPYCREGMHQEAQGPWIAEKHPSMQVELFEWR